MFLPRFVTRLPESPPRAVVLLVHGLNLHPERMDPIAGELLAAGAAVVRMALFGHRTHYDPLVRVTRGHWIRDFEDAAEYIRSEPSLRDLAFGLLGQSLGALTMCDWLMHASGPPAGGMASTIPASPRAGQSVAAQSAAAQSPAGQSAPLTALLLSPAIALRPRVHVLKPLIAVNRRLPIPSASDPRDRLYRHLPSGCYRAMFESYRALRRNLKRRPLPLDCCSLIAHRGDELVSWRGLERLAAGGSLAHSSGRTCVTALTGSEGRGARHLAVDRETVGEKEWPLLCERLRCFVDRVSSGE